MVRYSERWSHSGPNNRIFHHVKGRPRPILTSTYPFPNFFRPPYRQQMQMLRPQSAGALSKRPSTASSVPISLKPLQSTWRTTGSDFGASLPRPATADSSRPKWEYVEKIVLRFFAYFKEPVREGGSNDSRSGFRIRQCTISFYLEDNRCGKWSAARGTSFEL